MHGDKRGLLWLAAVLVAAALGLAACGGDDEDADGGQASGEPIQIGFAVGKTGLMEPFDVPPLQAAKLAIEDLEAEGGFAGRPVEVTERDTKSEPEQSANAAIELLDEGADLVVASCDFDFGGPAAAEANNAGVIGFSTCGASTKFGPVGIGPLAFTMATSAPARGATMAEWAFEDQGWDRAYVLEDVSIDYSQQLAESFTSRFQELAGEDAIVGEDTFNNEDESIASQVSGMEDAQDEFDAIYIGSYQPGIVSAMRQIRAAGIDKPILTSEDIDGDYWKDAVPDVSDIYFATYASIYGDDPNEEVNEFITRYEEQFGQPDTSSLVTGYSLIEAFAKAVEETEGDTNGEAVAAALEGFVDEPFLVGTTSFSPESHINITRDSRIMEIQDGETSFVTTWVPEEVPEIED